MNGPPAHPAGFQPDQVYLGWQNALLHPEPGPPPRRPVPPGPYRLEPGWIAAQRREEARLNRPFWMAGGGLLAGTAAAAGAGLSGVVTPALAAEVAVVMLLGATLALREVVRGGRLLRAAIGTETQRIAAAERSRERQLASWQQEHARRFRDWQECRRRHDAQPRWYPVTVPDRIDRVDVAGGTMPGWTALLTMIGATRLVSGGEVTVVDLSSGAVARDLAALAASQGRQPLVWMLPADLPRLDLGAGLPAGDLADVLAASAAPGPAGQDGTGAAEQSRDEALVARILAAAGDGAGIPQVLAGLRALGQIGDPRDDIESGVLTAAQLERVAALFGRGAADRLVTERAWTLEARLRPLERLGAGPVPLPASELRIIALDPATSPSSSSVLAPYLTVSLTHLLRHQPAGQPWRHTLCLAGAEKLSGGVLDALCEAAEGSRTGLVLAYRSLPPHVRARIGRGNAAVAFMRLGNAQDAKAASEQIGAEHRFVLAQLTDTVGSSVSATFTGSYTSTVGTSDSIADSISASDSRGRSRGRGQSRSDLAPFGPRTGTGSRDVNRSSSTGWSRALTDGISASTAWGMSTSAAIGGNESLARTTQRSREFLVEPHELQQLPPSAVIVSYAGRQGRQVVLADANPGIAALPTVTMQSLAEARRAAARRPGTAAARAPAPRTAAGGAPGGRPDGGALGGPPPDRGEPGERFPDGGQQPGGPPPDGREHAERPPSSPVSWRAKQDAPAPNLGPPAAPPDWRRARGSRR